MRYDEVPAFDLDMFSRLCCERGASVEEWSYVFVDVPLGVGSAAAGLHVAAVRVETTLAERLAFHLAFLAGD